MAGVQNAPSSRSRVLARILIVFTLAAVCVLGYTVGRPIYWRVYATMIRPFNADATLTEAQEVASATGAVQQGATAIKGKAGAGGFNPEDPKFALTKERAHAIAQDGYLMVTWSNHHYIDFVRSWLFNVERAGIKGYIVGALDDHILHELDKVKVNTWRMNSGLSTGDFGWGSKQFRKMGKTKINLIRQTIALELNIIISDVDVMWLRNPIPFFQKYPDVDLLTSSDHVNNTVLGEALETFAAVHSTANIGIMMFRPKAMPLADAWVKMVDKEDIWDQQAFNHPELFRLGLRQVEGDDRGVFWAFNGTIKMGVLPVALFAGGHTFFVQRLAETLGMKAYAAHATFQYSGTYGKRHRLREFDLFYDLPTYFEHPKGFIAFDMDLSPELLEKSAPSPPTPFTAESVKGHFNLIHHQYKRLRSAFALATLTGRAVIIPRLWCGVDKFWGPLESGRLGGSSNFKLPFQCPLDHVVRLEFGIFGPPMNNTAEYGPMIDIREHSFLQKANTPASLTQSVLKVEVCTAGSTGCASGASTPTIQDNTLKLQAGLAPSEAVKVLNFASDKKVWNFSTMAGVVEAPFEDAAAWAKFQKRLTMLPETFCCVNQHPGHFWYDFWFDRPHKDRFSRQFEGKPDEWISKRGDTNQP